MKPFPELTRRAVLKTLAWSLLSRAGSDRLAAAITKKQDEAYVDFLSPPHSSHPWVYWYFMDGYVSLEGMKADLDSMKKAGIGGGIFFEVDLGITEGPAKFMSPQWQQTVADAFRYADALGLEIALGAGPGWCGAGGPWVKPEESMQSLEMSVTRVRGPRRFKEKLSKPKSREPFFGENTLSPELRKVWDEFYVDHYLLAFPAPVNKTMIADVEEKALYTRGSFSSQILGPFTKGSWVRPALPMHADYPDATPKDALNIERVQDLTSRLSADGFLDWDIPEGEWILLRAGSRITGQTTRPAPKPGLGWETDKFNPAAAEHHFDAYVRTLLEKVGNRRNKISGLTTLHYDSWEMNSQNWTPKFATEFEMRRGYAPTEFLPAFAGFIVKDHATTERFLWDVRQTAQELVAANQMGKLKKLGQQYGLQMSLEPYDLDPCSDMELGKLADVPMCEFWSRFEDVNTDYSVVEATSVGHTNGRSVIAAEAFTAAFSERWLQHPASMKNQGDWAFCAGINRFVFHRFQSQSGMNKSPGMTMGPGGGYGVHWDRTQTWWDMVAPYHQYLSRCSALLQRGLFVADILYLAVEGAPNVFLAPPSAFQPGEFPDRWGYNFDGCAPSTLIDRASVKDGEIVFPDGMKYKLLVLPQVETMTPLLLKKVAELVEAGATVVGMPPKASPSLSGYPDCDHQVRAIALRLWGKAGSDAHEGATRSVGKGTVVYDTSAYRWAKENPLLHARWIWASGSNVPEKNHGVYVFTRKFQVEHESKLDIAEILVTGSPYFDVAVNGTQLGHGRVVNQVRRFDVTWLLRSGENDIRVTVDGSRKSQSEACGIIAALVGSGSSGTRLHIVTDAEWMVNRREEGSGIAAAEHGGFDAAPWKLTEASLQMASLYPPYRVTSRLLAERGICPDFEGEQIRAIHRRDAGDDIYFVANRADRKVETTWLFRVAGKKAEWWNPLTGERRLLGRYEESEGQTHVPVRLDAHESGFLFFRNRGVTTKERANPPAFRPVLTLEGAWDVAFDPNWGGPALVRFDRLEDWAQRPEQSIRYYSGKAVYRIRFDAAIKDVSDLFLSLGRVCNIASVRLNGRDLGITWVAPWRVAVPNHLLKPHDNKLEIAVVNLWWNRLVRDSKLPEQERLTWIPGKYPFTGDEPLQASGLLGPVRLEVRS